MRIENGELTIQNAISGNELLELVVGSVLAFVGLATLAFAATGDRARRAAPAWFGVFTAVYAVRLLVRVVALDDILGVSQRLAAFVGAGITYLILAPAVAATAEILDRRGPVLRRLWQADLLYGTIARAPRTLIRRRRAAADRGRSQPGNDNFSEGRRRRRRRASTADGEAVRRCGG